MGKHNKRHRHTKNDKLPCKECSKRKVAQGHTYCVECLLDLYKSDEVRLK